MLLAGWVVIYRVLHAVLQLYRAQMMYEQDCGDDHQDWIVMEIIFFNSMHQQRLSSSRPVLVRSLNSQLMRHFSPPLPINKSNTPAPAQRNRA